MKNWQKIGVAFLGCGINGALAFSVTVFPGWEYIISGAVVVVSGIMVKLIGWTPTK
jgi:hypothetical protein